MMNNSDQRATPPVDADQVLRSYFGRELPRHWPEFSARNLNAKGRGKGWHGGRRQPIKRSRLALAASLLVLIAGANIASHWGRQAAMPPEPLPHDVLPPTAQKPGKTHRPPAPPVQLPPLPANQR